jgi:hypothetical protein
MRQKTYEVWYALAAMIGILLVYVPVAAQGVPAASGVFGHGLGIIGFVLMLSTETLYSLRKRAPGRMSTWLQIHIFTGIVGPFLVLLHSSWKFNGLAGALMLMTVVIVISGFVGRYIYTAVPRTVDGAEVAVRDLEEQLARLDERLRALGLPPRSIPAAPTAARGARGVLIRPLARWRYRRAAAQTLKQVAAVDQAQAGQLRRLLDERFRWQQQIDSLAAARRLLAVWHTVHIPIGMALFTLAAIHIVETLYYATFIK